MNLHVQHIAAADTDNQVIIIAESFAEACKISKHSVVVAGHRTSISLETRFWFALKKAAKERSLTVASLVEEIDEKRSGNLSSAIRVWLFQNALEKNEKL